MTEMAQPYDEVTIPCGERGEIDVTDEQVGEPYLVGIGVAQQPDRENDYAFAYLELTREETVRLRDELTRRIGDGEPVCDCPEEDAVVRATRYTVAHFDHEPHAAGCPRRDIVKQVADRG